MKKFKTITVEKYNWSGNEILVTDFETQKEQVIKDKTVQLFTDDLLKRVINEFNQDGYIVTAIKGREHFMTKEIE